MLSTDWSRTFNASFVSIEGRHRVPANRWWADSPQQESKWDFNEIPTCTADAKRSSSSRISLFMSTLLKGGESGPSDMFVLVENVHYTMIN